MKPETDPTGGQVPRASLEALVLAGGRGSRMGPLTESRPKALVELAGESLLDHVLGHLLDNGVSRVIVAGGFGFRKLAAHLASRPDRDRIQALDTGIDTPTARRIAAAAVHVVSPRFVLCWCDGLTDIDLAGMVDFHCGHGRALTIAAVNPVSRYGELTLDGERVTAFREKPVLEDRWINAGYFVVEAAVARNIEPGARDWERHVIPELVRDDQVRAWRHHGAWHCVDTAADLEDARGLLSSRSKMRIVREG